MTYTTSEGVQFESQYTTDYVYQWYVQHGVSPNVARQEATVDLLRYGNDLPAVLQGQLAHLLERSDTNVAAGMGQESYTIQTAPLLSGAQQAQQAARPAPMASVVTTMGATERATATPTVGPVGLAYPDDPVNYATMQQSPANGYTGPGTLPSGIYGSPIGSSLPAPMAAGVSPGPGSSMTLYLVLGALAVGAYFLLKK